VEKNRSKVGNANWFSIISIPSGSR